MRWNDFLRKVVLSTLATWGATSIVFAVLASFLSIYFPVLYTASGWSIEEYFKAVKGFLVLGGFSAGLIAIPVFLAIRTAMWLTKGVSVRMLKWEYGIVLGLELTAWIPMFLHPEELTLLKEDLPFRLATLFAFGLGQVAAAKVLGQPTAPTKPEEVTP